ncbi:hypothetical protein [Tychonema sp. LEGE 06208]|nr:hypothetical protein [Tychonema sp. LEGE 06208]MBE9160772.1 hypothetical protein [Tychonema sp. LEGE 06208]
MGNFTLGRLIDFLLLAGRLQESVEDCNGSIARSDKRARYGTRTGA